MSKDFNEDLKLGDLGEQLWAEHLRSVGHQKISLSPKTHPVYWDVEIEGEGIRFEVKYDIKAWVWANHYNREPNLFLEYWSNTKEQECGILITEADYLVYIIEELPCGTPVAYVFDLKKLIQHLREAEKEKKYKTVTNKINGNENVKGWIAPLSKILNNEHGYTKTIILQQNINRTL